MSKAIEDCEREQSANFARQNGFHYLSLVSARELQKMEIPPLKWRVDKILPVGVCGFAAKSKSFKSFACIDLCLSVATGTDFLGFRTYQCSCVYLDLESGKRRPRDRINSILKGREAPDNFYILTLEDEIDKIGSGFEKQIAQIMEDCPDVGLIVIDVLTKIRPQRGANKDAYAADYGDIGALVKLAQTHDISIVFVTHFTKGDHEDVFDNMLGSSGTMGSLDTAWVIEKAKRSEKDATLHIQGRDVEPQELAISFDTNVMRWQNIGTPEEIEERERMKAYRDENIFRAIRQAVAESGIGKYEGSAAEIKQYGLMHNLPIWQDVSIIGRAIQDNADLLRLDGISVQFDKQRNKRKYIFIRHNCL